MIVQQEIEFAPSWPSIELVREAASRAVEAAFGDPTRCDAVGMVTAELLENAIKHTSVHDEPVRYRLHVDPTGFTVRVSNGCSHRDWKNVEELRETIEWIDSCDDPKQAYLLRSQQIYQSQTYREGNLGLVRVAYGGPCGLSYDFNPDTGRVAVLAQSLQSADESMVAQP